MNINLSGYLKRARARRLGLPIPPVTGLGNSYRLNFLGFPIGPRGHRSSRADLVKIAINTVASKHGIPLNVVNELIDAVHHAGFAPDARRHAFKELVEDLQREFPSNPTELDRERKAFTQ
jgi:hypothetical protein